MHLKDIVEYLPKAQSQVVLEGEWDITLPQEVQENAQKGMMTRHSRNMKNLWWNIKEKNIFIRLKSR